jgi:ketosteroid isomerase-like protein
MNRFIVVLSLFSISCSSAAVDLDAERQGLMDTDRAFAQATAERGVEGWLDFHLATAHNIPEAGPVAVGHEAIRESMTAFLSDTTRDFTWEPVFADVSDDGTLGFTYGDWSVTHRATDSLEVRGRYLTVWRKDAGRWKVSADIGNTERR